MKNTAKTERAAVRERLLKRTREEMAREWESPEYREGYRAWDGEYKSEVLLHKARTQAGLTQCALAERMHTRRANISRMERGQNVTFATFARFLNACGYHFRISMFPIESRKRTPKADQAAFA